MASYTIGDLEKLSGIKAHTIRMWEKRFELLQPKRTKTNIRSYEEKDLRLVMNIALLKKNGYKISEIAQFKQSEINKLADQLTLKEKNNTDLDGILLAMFNLDELKFDQLFKHKVDLLGFENTISQVIFPLLDKLSLLWITGSIKPVQQSFMSYALRQKIISAIDQIDNPDPKKYSFLLYLPEGENQQVSMLYIHYILKSRGFRTLNLGQGIHTLDLYEANKIYKPDFIFTMINDKHPKLDLQEYIEEVNNIFCNSRILLSGSQIINAPLTLPSNTEILASLQNMIQYLDQLKFKK